MVMAFISNKKIIFFTSIPLMAFRMMRSEEHTSELQSQSNLVCRLLLEKKNRPHNRDRDAEILGDDVAALTRNLHQHSAVPDHDDRAACGLAPDSAHETAALLHNIRTA